MSGIIVHVDVMEIAKDKKEEIGEEQDNMTVEQEIQQLVKVDTTQQMMTDKPKSEESDTPVQKNEEVMWPEDGVLLKFVEKTSRKQKENAVTEIQATSAMKETEGGIGSLTLFSKRMTKLRKNYKSHKLKIYRHQKRIVRVVKSHKNCKWIVWFLHH